MEAYFTRKYGDFYGEAVIAYLLEHLDGEAITEAFFAVHAQVDMLVEEGAISLVDGEYSGRSEWTAEQILLANEEVAAIARRANSPMLVAIEKLVACMRRIYETAHLAPAADFRDRGDDEPEVDKGDDADVLEVRLSALPEGMKTFRLRVAGRVAAEQPIVVPDDDVVAAAVVSKPEVEPEPEILPLDAVHLDRGVSSLSAVECGLWYREAPKRSAAVGDVTCRQCKQMAGVA